MDFGICLYCNMCKTKIPKNKFGYIDDHLHIEKRWNYGSIFDNEVHSIIICQACYGKIVDTLQISPIAKTNDNYIQGSDLIGFN